MIRHSGLQILTFPQWFVAQDPLIKILCVALLITVFLSYLGYAEWFEGVGIAAAVFIATFVSTWSEYKNEVPTFCLLPTKRISSTRDSFSLSCTST